MDFLLKSKDFSSQIQGNFLNSLPSMDTPLILLLKLLTSKGGKKNLLDQKLKVDFVYINTWSHLS